MSTADESKQTPDVSDDMAMDAPTPAAKSSPGNTLREARERKGMSLEQVAKETLLTARYLRALEADDYDTLPGTTFVRGYLRRYAGVVALSADALVADFDAIWLQRNAASAPLIDAQVHALQQEPVGNRRRSRRSSMFKRTARQFSLAKLLSFGSVALLLTLLFASLFWNDTTPVAPMTNADVELDLGSDSTMPEASAVPTGDVLAASASEAGSGDAVEAASPAAAESPSDVGPTPAAPAPALPVPASALPAPAPAPTPAVQAPESAMPAAAAANVTTTAAASVLSSSPVDAPAIATSAPVPPRIDSLSFSFTGKSWISVRDATGQELVYGLKNTGQSVTVTGQPPFAINIGSVRDTQMSRNGVPINLKPYTRGEIASFRLGR